MPSMRSARRFCGPSLANEPVGALFNNSGGVFVRFAKARAIDVPTAKPGFACRDLFRRRDVAWTPGEKRFMNFLRPILVERCFPAPRREVPEREV